jgi:KTSC domain
MLRICFAALVGMISVATAANCAEPPTPPNHIISHIPRQRVASTAIAAVGYSKRQHILEIEFVNGAIYRYFDVPPAVHRDLMSVDSKARFYDFNIKGHYRSVPIRPQQKEQMPAKSSASAQGYGATRHE